MEIIKSTFNKISEVVKANPKICAAIIIFLVISKLIF